MTDSDKMEDRDRAVQEIQITQEMIEAGLDEMRQHQIGDDLGYVVECVYRAMAYSRFSASSTNPVKYAKPSSATASGDRA